jgi:hypothetical protein
MANWATVFLPAAFGSAVQELAYWWELRFKLTEKKYREQMRSVAYWIVVFAMVVGSGIGTVVWFSSETVEARDVLILGAAFPLLFKHAVSAVEARANLGRVPQRLRQDAPWSILSYITMR